MVNVIVVIWKVEAMRGIFRVRPVNNDLLRTSPSTPQLGITASNTRHLFSAKNMK